MKHYFLNYPIILGYFRAFSFFFQSDYLNVFAVYNKYPIISVERPLQALEYIASFLE